MLSLLVAMSENRVIGKDGALPWHLSADLKRFKRLTMGHTLVMGRRTHESIGQPLPGRRTIVLTRQTVYSPEGVETASNLATALELAAEDSEVFVVGGAEVYADALPEADRIYLTRIHAQFEGDTSFPPLDKSVWRLVESERHPADDGFPHDYSFEIWERAAT